MTQFKNKVLAGYGLRTSRCIIQDEKDDLMNSGNTMYTSGSQPFETLKLMFCDLNN